MDGAWRRPTDSRLCSGTPSLSEVPSGGARALCLLSRFSKVSRRQGGTLSGRYRRNGYVLAITASPVRPPSRASPLPQLDRGVSGREVSADRSSSQASQLPQLDRGVSGREVSAGRPSSQASQLPQLDRGVSGREVSAGRPSSQASQLPQLDRGVSGREVSAGRPSSQASQLPQLDRGCQVERCRLVGRHRRQASSHS